MYRDGRNQIHPSPVCPNHDAGGGLDKHHHDANTWKRQKRDEIKSTSSVDVCSATWKHRTGILTAWNKHARAFLCTITKKHKHPHTKTRNRTPYARLRSPARGNHRSLPTNTSQDMTRHVSRPSQRQPSNQRTIPIRSSSPRDYQVNPPRDGTAISQSHLRRRSSAASAAVGLRSATIPPPPNPWRLCRAPQSDPPESRRGWV